MVDGLTCARFENPRARRKGFTLGRADFEKISAVEGIRYPAEMKRTFRQLDKQGASPAQRKKIRPPFLAARCTTILIDENSFERLALCMMALNSEAAMNAFGAALQVGRAQARKMFGY